MTNTKIGYRKNRTSLWNKTTTKLSSNWRNCSLMNSSWWVYDTVQIIFIPPTKKLQNHHKVGCFVVWSVCIKMFYSFDWLHWNFVHVQLTNFKSRCSWYISSCGLVLICKDHMCVYECAHACMFGLVHVCFAGIFNRLHCYLILQFTIALANNTSEDFENFQILNSTCNN